MNKKHYQLIKKCKKGETSALAWLYRTYAPILLGVCRRYINNKAQAEDILHESFIVIFNKIDSLKNDDALEGWMKKIVVNNALKFLKHQVHFYDIDEMLETESTSTNEHDNENLKDKLNKLEIDQEQMLSIIDELPNGYKAVFNLYVFENQSHIEIGKQLDISASTSRSQLQRARKKIQLKLIAIGNKKQKNEYALFLLPPMMTDKLAYIDEIALKHLKDINIIPVSSSMFLTEIANSIEKKAQPNTLNVAKQLLSKTAVWSTFSVLLVGSIFVCAFWYENSEPEKLEQLPINIDLEKIHPAENHVIPDSILKTPEADTLPPKDEIIPAEYEKIDTIKQKQVVHRKKVIKKIVRRRKTIVADTIIKVDPVQTR